MIAVKRDPKAPRNEWLEWCSQYKQNPSNTFLAEYSKGNTVVIFGLGNSSWLAEHFIIEDGVEQGVELNPSNSTDMKFDGGKARVDLLLDGCPKAIEAVAKVLTFGANKYADHSWQSVDKGPARYKAALLRHLLAHAAGESTDSESGLSHLAHAACNAMFILELELKKDA